MTVLCNLLVKKQIYFEQYRMGEIFLRVCCVTGHRRISADRIDFVKSELHKEIMNAINEGYTHFISGFAECVDIYFAEIVAELKSTYPHSNATYPQLDTIYPQITLEAAIPYRKRLENKNKLFNQLIELCDKVTVVSEKYNKNCFMLRNMYMVSNSTRLIAVYDGREKGGTIATIRYGRKINCELHIIQI